MKILYLSSHVPNPTKIRSHFHVRGLLDAGHQVTIASLERSAQDLTHIKRLCDAGARVISEKITKFQLAWNALRVLPGRLPLQSNFLWSKALMTAIQAHLKSDPPDII